MNIGTVGIVCRGRGTSMMRMITALADKSYRLNTQDIVFNELTSMTPYELSLFEYLTAFKDNDLIITTSSNYNLRYYLLERNPIKHVVSKAYIDDFNESMIGKIYRETIKEGCNAFDILQFTGDRGSKCHDNTKGCKQTRTNTVGTPNGKDAYRHRFTFR